MIDVSKFIPKKFLDSSVVLQKIAELLQFEIVNQRFTPNYWEVPEHIEALKFDRETDEALVVYYNTHIRPIIGSRGIMDYLAERVGMDISISEWFQGIDSPFQFNIELENPGTYIDWEYLIDCVYAFKNERSSISIMASDGRCAKIVTYDYSNYDQDQYSSAAGIYYRGVLICLTLFRDYIFRIPDLGDPNNLPYNLPPAYIFNRKYIIHDDASWWLDERHTYDYALYDYTEYVYHIIYSELVNLGKILQPIIAYKELKIWAMNNRTHNETRTWLKSMEDAYKGRKDSQSLLGWIQNRSYEEILNTLTNTGFSSYQIRELTGITGFATHSYFPINNGSIQESGCASWLGQYFPCWNIIGSGLRLRHVTGDYSADYSDDFCHVPIDYRMANKRFSLRFDYFRFN